MMIKEKIYALSMVLVLLLGAHLDAATIYEATHNDEGALLQTEINTTPLMHPHSKPGRIQPGTRMKLTAVVKNSGTIASAPGTIYVRFALPEPLDKQPNSVIFTTETRNIPSIPPGNAVTIEFSTPHQWSSLFDFIRDDWAMREYEAVVNVGNEEKITGTRSIAFSVYYYEGPSYEKPVHVSSAY